VKTITVRVDSRVLVSDEDFTKLWLHDPLMQTTWAARIQSHMGDAPLLEGRESEVRVGLLVKDEPKKLELVA
jgi:hypothetical protein